MVAFFLPHAVVAATIGAYLLDHRWAFAIPTWAFFAGLLVDQLFTARERSALAPHAGRPGWRLILYARVPLHARGRALRSSCGGAPATGLCDLLARPADDCHEHSDGRRDARRGDRPRVHACATHDRARGGRRADEPDVGTGTSRSATSPGITGWLAPRKIRQQPAAAKACMRFSSVRSPAAPCSLGGPREHDCAGVAGPYGQ